MIKKYHSQIADNFEGFYSRYQQPFNWDKKTVHLGSNYDSLLTTLPSYAIQYEGGDKNSNSPPLHSLSIDYQAV